MHIYAYFVLHLFAYFLHIMNIMTLSAHPVAVFHEQDFMKALGPDLR